MRLDRHQSDQSMKKFSSRRSVTHATATTPHGDNAPSTRFSAPGKIIQESERSSPNREVYIADEN